MTFSAEEAASITGGNWRGGEAEIVPARIVTDSRCVQPGNVFVALRGEHFDGNEYVAQAVEAGAAAAVCERYTGGEAVPQLVVKDSLHALGELARAWRARHRSIPTLAICGSGGKTTTKNMAAHILGAHRRTHATEGNLNNLIGLPQTLFRLTAEHEVSVLEIGMNVAGENARLMEICDPDAVLMTNVGNAHIGNFGGQEGLYLAETEPLRDAAAGIPFLLNADDDLSLRARREYAEGHPVTTFGVEQEADVRATDIRTLEPFGYAFRLRGCAGGTVEVELRLFGRHNVANAAAAAAIGRHFGLTAEQIAAGLAGFRPKGNRSELEPLGGGLVVKDFYNASPAAVELALASLAEIHAAGPRVALLADMMELGSMEEEFHRRVGRAAAAAGLDELVTLGTRARIIHEEARAWGAAAVHFEDYGAAAAHVFARLGGGGVLLIKGSRAMRLEDLYAQLKRLAETAA